MKIQKTKIGKDRKKAEAEDAEDNNLLVYLKETLAKNGKTLENIKWVGTFEYFFDKDWFFSQLKNIGFFGDPIGNCSCPINEGIVIAGDDFLCLPQAYVVFELVSLVQPKNSIKVKCLNTDNLIEA